MGHSLWILFLPNCVNLGHPLHDGQLVPGFGTVFLRRGGNVTSAGWQVILCDPIWHVCSRSGEASR